MLTELYQWTLEWASSPEAPWALFGIALVESIFFPIPPDALLIAMGLAVPEQALKYAFICTAGSVIGGGVGFYCGRWAGRPLITRIISIERREKIEKIFNEYGAWAIAMAGFTPLPYKIFTLTAGAFRIPFKIFIVASSLSRGARFFLIGLILRLWGAQLSLFIQEHFNKLTLLSIPLFIGLFFLYRLFRKKSAAV